MARDKDRTKTSEDGLVELCPRALDVLKRHLALRARLVLAGQIRHDNLFFKEDGSPIGNLQYPWVRWRRTLRALKARYRESEDNAGGTEMIQTVAAVRQGAPRRR